MSKIFAQDTDCLFLIEQAVKAPSGHNTQPWTFRIKETEIDILPDFTKTLPVVDPDNRELFVSLGCATENLCVAAAHKGYETMVSIAENGTIHIELTKQDSDTPSPLFPHISVRQTKKRAIWNLVSESISSRMAHGSSTLFRKWFARATAYKCEIKSSKKNCSNGCAITRSIKMQRETDSAMPYSVHPICLASLQRPLSPDSLTRSHKIEMIEER